MRGRIYPYMLYISLLQISMKPMRVAGLQLFEMTNMLKEFSFRLIFKFKLSDDFSNKRKSSCGLFAIVIV